MKELNKQNNINSLEDLKKEFEIRFNVVKDSEGYWFNTLSNQHIDASTVWGFIEKAVTTHEQQARREGVEYILKYANSRLKQHTDNLELWKNGTLTPTEPDEQRREITIEGLNACIFELNELKKFLEENPSA